MNKYTVLLASILNDIAIQLSITKQYLIFSPDIVKIYLHFSMYTIVTKAEIKLSFQCTVQVEMMNCIVKTLVVKT